MIIDIIFKKRSARTVTLDVEIPNETVLLLKYLINDYITNETLTIKFVQKEIPQKLPETQ